jgi:PAP2 superfamily
VGRTIHHGSLAYPSTHTAQSAAFAMVTALLVIDLLNLGPSAGAALVLGSAAVGAVVMGSALVAGSVHYVTDTVGGLGIALAVVTAAACCTDLVGDRYRRDHIAALADRVIGCVTCGHSGAERVSTAADLVRAAGLNLQFCALLRTDVTDGSTGEVGRDRPRPADSPDSPAHTKPTALSGGSPPSPLLRSTSQAPEGARPSSTQKSRLQ